MRRLAFGIEKIEHAFGAPIQIAVRDTGFSPETSLASATAGHMLELMTIEQITVTAEPAA
jgi:hypothetical protein